MSNIQFYDFNLNAGGTQYLPASGAYYRIISSTGAVSITEDGGAIAGPLQAGQGMKNRDFKWLSINDKSGAANKGVLIVAGSDFVDDRITGEVSVINGERARTMSGIAYVGKLYTAEAIAPVAASYCRGQLFNPVGSGKNIWLTDMQMFASSEEVSTPNPGTCYLIMTKTASVLPSKVACQTGPICKRIGGPASVAQFWVSTANEAAAVAIPRADVIVEGTSKIQTAFPLKLQEPILIQPGVGLSFCGRGLGVDVALQYVEDAL